MELLDLLHGTRVLGGIEILLLLDVDNVIAEPLPSFVSKIYVKSMVNMLDQPSHSTEPTVLRSACSQ